MQNVDDTFDLLTEEVWQDLEYERPATSEPVSHSRGRMGRFLDSLAASMSLQHKSYTTSRSQSAMYATDILAQHYPHLYLRVMCG